MIVYDIDENDIIDINDNADAVLSEIESYADYEDGWDFGEGDTFSSDTVLNAKRVYLECILQGFKVEPHPKRDGSIKLIAYVDEHFLDIIITDTNQLKLRYEVGIGSDYVVKWKNKQASFSTLNSELRDVWNKATLSAYLTSKKISAVLKSDSIMMKPSYPTKVASPSSMKVAQGSQLRLVFART